MGTERQHKSHLIFYLCVAMYIEPLTITAIDNIGKWKK